MGLVQSHRMNKGDRKLVCRRNLYARARQGEAWASPTIPSGCPLSFLTSHAPRPALNCSTGRSSDIVNASRWVWANRRPGKVRKAPSREPRTASPTRMASLARGSLGEERGPQPACSSQPAPTPSPFPGLTPSPSPASSEVAPSSGSYWPGLGKTRRRGR